jgi:parvulin-like peptidyl-prolyl isomerase
VAAASLTRRSPVARAVSWLGAFLVPLGVALVFGVALTAAGCGGSRPADKVIARVDGQPVYQSQLDLERRGVSFTQQEVTEKQLLDTLIDEELVRQQAARLKLSVTPTEIEARLREVERQVGGTAALEQALKSSGLDRAGLGKRIAVVLEGEKVQDAMFRAVKASRAEALRYYRQNPDAFRRPAAVRLASIVVRNDGMARSALAKIRQGQSFAVTARQFSRDVETKEGGGMLGWVAVPSLPQPLAEAVAKLRPGQISAPVSAPGGVYILKLYARRAASLLSFSTVGRELRRQLTAQQRQRALAAWVKDVRGGAEIEIVH